MENKITIIAMIFILIYSFGYYYNEKGKIASSTMPAMASNGHTVDIIRPYAFATAENAKTAAAFFTIQNNTPVEDKLIHVWSDIAEINEIHENLIDPDTGVMMMRKIKELEVPAQGQILLEPKGYHIMFINLKKPLIADEVFLLTLVFDKSGEQRLEVTIMPPGMTPEEPAPVQPHYHP